MPLVRTPKARAPLVPHMTEGNRAKTASAPLVAILATSHEPLMVVHIGRPGLDTWFPHAPRLPYADVVTTV
ncbi:hypothetical protein GCM10018785_52020 [Streptomyces longispororuber]|uniref:Uncharacterized protein n=1 Tax=Streptomyces longispororuber TaxID=68230 RepID=A0A918ZYA2_9ACTN|nr:hypothetical protein GCM10018785_52020 [Streptomyces longispororuber]